jgi:hypothetical protein
MRQMHYRMNSNYAAKIKEKINKYSEAIFIYPIDKIKMVVTNRDCTK